MALNNSGQFAGFFATEFSGFVGQSDGTFDLLPVPGARDQRFGEIAGIEAR